MKWRKLLKVAAFVIFPASIMVSFEIHERFKGHFLNEIRVSFKSSALLEKNLAHFLQLWLCSVECSIGHFSRLLDMSHTPCQSTQTWLRVKHQLRCCCNPLLLTWFKKKKIKIPSSLIAKANVEIYRHAQLRKKKDAD